MTAADETIVAQLQSNDDSVRIAAMHAVTAGDMSPAVTAHIRMALLSPCAEIRLAAIACWQRCDCGPHDEGIQATYDRVDAVRAAAYALVLQWPTIDVQAVCHRGLLDRSALVRMAVLQANVVIPTALLHDRLHDSDRSVAYYVAERLALQQDAQALAWLFESESRGIAHKRLAIRVFGRAGITAAVPMLMHEVQQRTPCMLCSIDALGALAHPDSFGLLMVLIADVSHEVRIAAIKALVACHAPDVIVPVMRQAVICDSRKHVQVAAVDVLNGYNVAPSHTEFLAYAAHVKKIPRMWLAALVDGPVDDVVDRLRYLYDAQIATPYRGFTSRLLGVILARHNAAALLQACIASDHPYLVLLGVMGYETHRMPIRDEAIIGLLTHADAWVREASTLIVRTTMHHNGALLRMVWQGGDDYCKRLLIAPILRHDAEMRALVWQSTCSILRHQVITVLHADMRSECHIIACLSGDEIMHLEGWCHDTRLQNRFQVNDVIGMWHHLSRASA